MSQEAGKPKRSAVQVIFASIAITTGTMAFLQAGMRGHRVGWEEMLIYSTPAVLGGLVAVAIRRNGLGIAALIFALLGAVGFVLGA
jgi:2-keto-3-deoxy-galactonokinase